MFFGINDENGQSSTNFKKALKRRRNCLEEISHPTNTSTAQPRAPVQKITVEEKAAALKNMRPGKVTETDDVAADLISKSNLYPN